MNGREMLAHITSCCRSNTAYCGTPSETGGTGFETRDLCIVCADYDVRGACGVCGSYLLRTKGGG